MNEFDAYIKQKIKEEESQVPRIVNDKIEQALSELPQRENKPVKPGMFPKIAAAAACVLFVCLFVLPNCSTVYAQALENVPVIGRLVKVVTIRNYFYSDGSHEMDINVPKIEGEKNDTAEDINQEVDAFTGILVDEFYRELEETGKKGHSGVHVDYEVVTNTEEWFTLKLRIQETAGSSNTYYKYYHIDKNSGRIVYLEDLFATDRCYAVLEEEIRRQMEEIMAEDADKIYWLDNAEGGQGFVKLDGRHIFYWNDNNDLVIAFDKYEVAPGYMGTPEFVIKKEVIADILKPEYR